MLLSFRASDTPVPGLPADWRRAAGWLLAAGLVQATILHFFAIRSAVPSLIFLVVASYAVRSGVIGAILFGAAAGLLEDALAGNTGAGWTIATTLTALGVSLSTRILFTDSLTIFATIVFAGVLVREGLFWAALSLMGYQTGLGMHFTKIAVASALYTTLLALVIGWARWRFQPSR